MEKIKNYPSHIARPFTEFTKADDESAMHKSLLDMGESFLTYLVGIMFGEYKRSGDISDRLESEFYKYSSRKPSFGVFLSFMRMLSTEMTNTILTDKFEKGKKYLAVSEFISEFELLKKVINDGADDGLSDKVEALRKGHTAGQKGLMDFFNIFISIRNTYAHPDDKAGPSEGWKNNNPKPPKKDKKGMDEYNVKMKSALRKWPLGDDYYAFINPLMHAAISELVEDFEILQSYKPILAKLLDDKNKKGTFLIELGAKETELELDLSTDDLRFMNTDLRYLLDPDDKLFVKLYYHAIPQLNPEVAKKIIDREKAKAMEPHMLEMIHAKLVDDGKIDEMEYLVLRDTAKTSAISDERLFQLIDKVRNKLGIKDIVGTPDDLGDIFIEAKDKESNPKFNPWWLGYLSMVGKIDKKVVKGEQTQKEKIDQSIKKLKNEKKSLPVMKRLANAKKNIKDKKAQKSKQIKKINERIAAKREMRKKASKPERKRDLLTDIEELKIAADEKKLIFDDQILELSSKIEEIENEKIDRVSAIDDKITALSNQLDEYSRFTQWGMHKNLWQEINQYIDHLLDENLNTSIGEISDEDDDVSTSEWINTPNAWQIGALAYTYWAKIHPSEAPLGMTYHVGYAISNRFKWVPKNIHESLVETLKKPCSIIWTTQDDQNAEKIDLDGSLGRKKAELNASLLESYEKELLELGANVRCTLSTNKFHGKLDEVRWDHETYFMPLEKFLEVKDEYSLESLYSRLWPLDAFYNGGTIDMDALSKYERESVTMLQIFSNVVIQLNDYALEIGINQETISERFDQYNRLKDTMFIEFEKKFPVGTLFRPSKEEDLMWREFASKELGLSDYLYDMMASNFRFSSGYNARKYFKDQRDKHKPGTKEYEEWNQKIIELN